jgi:hypothetical protein
MKNSKHSVLKPFKANFLLSCLQHCFNVRHLRLYVVGGCWDWTLGLSELLTAHLKLSGLEELVGEGRGGGAWKNTGMSGTPVVAPQSVTFLCKCDYINTRVRWFLKILRSVYFKLDFVLSQRTCIALFSERVKYSWKSVHRSGKDHS